MLNHAHGNSVTADSAKTCTGNSATATKLQTARNIAITGAVTGNVNFDGSGNAIINTTQDNIVILTGEVTLTAPNEGDIPQSEKLINYPNGFNKNNTAILTTNIKRTGNEWLYGINNSYSRIMWSGLLDHVVVLQDNNVRFIISSGESGWGKGLTLQYKIVLMKTS